VLALQLAGLGLLLLEGALQQPRPEDLDRHLPILRLGALVLALGHDAGRQVGQPDGRVGLVHVLAAGPLAAERVDPDLVPVQLDLVDVLGLREDLHEGERGLPSLLRVEGADPDQAVHAALGAQPAVRRATLDLDGHTLQPGLLPLLLIHDLGVEAVPLGPAEVHAEEHLGPVRRLGAAGASADREERRALVVLTREEELCPLPGEVGLERHHLAVQLGGELRVARLLDQLEGRQQVVDAGLEAAPERNVVAQTACLAEGLLCVPLVVPEPGILGQRLELGDPRFPRLEVKDAPRSPGSVRPGPAWRRRPSVAPLQVLEKDRPKLDQAQGRLAPGDDGVDTRAVAVVGADAAVAVTVEGGGIAARSAVPLASDEIRE
jgi:hypothetical protein